MASSTDDVAERECFLDKVDMGIKHDSRRGERKWKIAACIFMAISVIQFFMIIAEALYSPRLPLRTAQSAASGRYDTGFSTDLETFKPALKLVQTRFTGALHPDSDGNFYMMVDPNEPKYVGASAEETDKNWQHLITGRYFNLTEAELAQLDPRAFDAGAQAPNPHNIKAKMRATYGGIDMFHSLHCLNALRKALEGRMPGIAGQNSDSFMKHHMNHCVDQIRQALMCHGDLTPVTLTPVYNLKSHFLTYLGQTEYPHTCRDWKALRQELSKRKSPFQGPD